MRYKVPATVKREMIRRNIKSAGKILLRVPSRIEADQYYTVDMTIGVCECAVGFDGSLCTHQHSIWAENLAGSLNFVLIFNITERQRWARIVFGTAFPLTYYEGLHSLSRTQTFAVNFVADLVKARQKVSYIKRSVIAFLCFLDVQLTLS